MKIVLVQNSYNEIPEEDRGRIGPDDRIITIRHQTTWQILDHLTTEPDIFLSPQVHHIPTKLIAKIGDAKGNLYP